MNVKLDEQLVNIEGENIEVDIPITVASKVLKKSVERLKEVQKNNNLDLEEKLFSVKDLELLLSSSLADIKGMTYRKMLIIALRKSDSETNSDSVNWISIFDKLRDKKETINLSSEEAELLKNSLLKIKKNEIDNEAKHMTINLLSKIINKKDK